MGEADGTTAVRGERDDALRYGHSTFDAKITTWAEIPAMGDAPEQLAVAYAGGIIRVWDLESGESSPPLAVFEHKDIAHLCVSASGIIAATSKGALRRATLDGNEAGMRREEPWCAEDNGLAACGLDILMCSPSSDRVVILADDGRAHVLPKLDAPSGDRRIFDGINSLALAPDGVQLALARGTEGDMVPVASLLRDALDPKAKELPLPCSFSATGYYSSFAMFAFSPASDFVAVGRAMDADPSQVCLWEISGKKPVMTRLPVGTIEDECEDCGFIGVPRLEFTPDGRALEGSMEAGWSGKDDYVEVEQVLTWDLAKVAGKTDPPPTRRQSPKAHGGPRLQSQGPRMLVAQRKGPARSLPEWTETDALLTSWITTLAVSPSLPDAEQGPRLYLIRDWHQLVVHDATREEPLAVHDLGPTPARSPDSFAVSDDGQRAVLGVLNVLPEENAECDPHGPEPGALFDVSLGDPKDPENPKKATTARELDSDLERGHTALAFLPGTHTALVCTASIELEDAFVTCDGPHPTPHGQLAYMNLDDDTKELSPVSVDACPTRNGLALQGGRVAVLRLPSSEDEEEFMWGWGPYTLEVLDLHTGESLFHQDPSKAAGIDDYALSEDGSALIILTEDAVEVYAVDSGERLTSIDYTDVRSPNCVALNADGSRFAMGFGTGEIRLGSPTQPETTGLPALHTRGIQALRFADDGSLYAISQDRSASRWPLN